MQSTSPKVTLVSNDGVEVQATLTAVKKCVTLSTMLEVLDESKTANQAIPVPGVDGETLRAVIEWCEQDIPKFEEAATEIPELVNNFHRNVVPNGDLFFKLIDAANYLEIEVLLQYALHQLARTIEPMSTEEMREYLNIKNDFTPEEEAELRRSHAWAMQEPEQ